jgi:hypothetical protein
MTERVTVEYNGELVTVDVPDGTTDDQIKSYLAGQRANQATKELTTAPTFPGQDVAEAYATQSAVPGLAARNLLCRAQLGKERLTKN